jgi:Flp pilus assembly pilin Flp
MVRPIGGLTERREAGQGLAEYALILTLISVALILVMTFLGDQISGVLSTVSNAI